MANYDYDKDMAKAMFNMDKIIRNQRIMLWTITIIAALFGAMFISNNRYVDELTEQLDECTMQKGK